MAEQAELTRPRSTAAKQQMINPATNEPGKAYDSHSIEQGQSGLNFASPNRYTMSILGSRSKG